MRVQNYVSELHFVCDHPWRRDWHEATEKPHTERFGSAGHPFGLGRPYVGPFRQGGHRGLEIGWERRLGGRGAVSGGPAIMRARSAPGEIMLRFPRTAGWLAAALVAAARCGHHAPT